MKLRLADKPRAHRAAALAATIALFAGCSHQQQNGSPRRLAILPANILIADPHSEWMRLAIPLVLAQNLGAARGVIPALVSSESGVYAAGASDSFRTTIEDRAGKLEIHANLSALATQRVERSIALQTGASDLIGSLDQLAKQIDSQASTFGTHNTKALEAFAAGVFSSDRAIKIQRLNDAIAADSAFGLAYTALAEADPANAGAVLERAKTHVAEFTPVDRARFDFVRARLLHAPLSAQAAAGAALIALTPNDADALATVSSVLFSSGKAADGERLMGRALEINPENANLRLQLATGLIENRQFARAEKILDGLASNASTLPTLAVCVFFEGDRKRASSIYDKFLESVPNQDAKTLLKASWQALTGDRSQAIAFVQNAQMSDPRLTAFANTQVVVWQLLDQQRDAARKTAANAGPIAELLAAGAHSAGEWQRKVDALPAGVANAQVKKALLRYGYFLCGFYPDAAEAWKQADREAGGADLIARAMLAGSLAAAGRTDEAKQVRVQPFVPDFSDFFSAVSFSQLLRYTG